MSTLIAIETSTESCSAALMRDGDIIERSELAPRRHAELILPMIESLLAEAGLSRRQIDAVAVGRGPGAFTGVRLAISVAQGIGLGLDIPVITISSLAALAQDVPADIDAPILAVIDARMGEVYSGAFRRNSDGTVEPLTAESVGPASMIVIPKVANAKNGQWAIIGSGWSAYQDAVSARLSALPIWSDGARYPQARAVARLAAPQLALGQGMAADFALPVYLRDKVALTLDEQRAR
ncbi:MAG: tRNA (adenosine(37)-N6)-threonylcarbamoyltransferase complex dimerization subunit type 1 TsaB [Rudaea sp.]